MHPLRHYGRTSFTVVSLTPTQEAQGQILNQDQRDVIQNRRAALAEEILHKTFSYNISEPTNYGIELAYLQGQLDVLSEQISTSDDATKFIVSESQNQDS